LAIEEIFFELSNDWHFQTNNNTTINLSSMIHRSAIIDWGTMGPAAKLPPCTTRLGNGEDRHPIDKNRNPNISTGVIEYRCRQ